MTRRPTSLPLELFDPTPAVGRRIVLGEGRNLKYHRLLEGDDYCDAGFPGCAFRIQMSNYQLATNVTVTGRVARWFDGEWHVRAKVEFVGDCEPSTFVNGWVVL